MLGVEAAPVTGRDASLAPGLDQSWRPERCISVSKELSASRASTISKQKSRLPRWTDSPISASVRSSGSRSPDFIPDLMISMFA
jgi:hypothetical protein